MDQSHERKRTGTPHGRGQRSPIWASHPCVWGILLAITSGYATACQGQESAPLQIEATRVGIEGHYRVGHWTPVRVQVQSTTAWKNVQLELMVPDGEGVWSRTISRGYTIDAGASTTLEAFVKFGRVHSELRVRLRDADGRPIAAAVVPAAELPDARLASQHLVLTLGADIGVGDAIAARRQKVEQETLHAVVREPASLPRHWQGYQGFRLIVLSGSEPFVAQLTQEQLTALEEWVQMGGRLLLALGASAETTVANEGPLARFVPGKLERIQLQRQTIGLESFAGNTAKSLDSFVDKQELSFRLPMASISDVQGRVELSEGIGRERIPTIVRSSHGFGHVIFLSIDLDRPPLSLWRDGRKKMLSKLMDMSLEPTARDDSDRQYAKLTQIGFDDLTGQLRAGLDQFADVRLVPFSWIGVLVAIYIVLIGPLDYFLLRGWRQRFGLTWLTFPLWVLLGCAAALLLTQHWKGDRLTIHQIDVVDVDMGSGLLRRHTWSHLFSPTSRKYDIRSTPSSAALAVQDPQGQLTSWQGLPGKSFGGMNTARLSGSASPYEILCDFEPRSHQVARIAGIPIDLYASRSFSCLAWGQVELPTPEVLTADVDNQLSGRLRNPLPFSLRDCKLCYGRWVYPLPSLAPDAVVEVDRFSKIKTIDGILTRTQVDQDFKDKSQPWDRKSLEIGRIMEMMMFHEAAGGTEYTSLLHRFQGEIDFTDHLTEGKALLVGKTDDPASMILEDANIQRQTHTYYRLLIPVTTPPGR